MRIKVTLLFEDEISHALVNQVGETLKDIAVAFGHSFIIKEERIAQSPKTTYGMELAEKTLQTCEQSDAVFVCAQSETVINVLADELGYIARSRAFLMPDVLKPLSPLRTDRPLSGMIVQAIGIEAEQVRTIFEFAIKQARQEKLTLMHIPPAGSSRSLWMQVVSQYSIGGEEWHLVEAADAIPDILRSQSGFGLIMAAPYPGSIVIPAITALFGIPGILYDEYIGASTYMYAHLVSYAPLCKDDANPIGLLKAVAAFLQSKFGMCKEADCVDAAIHNVLEAGWRTNDISMTGFPRVSMSAVGKLISEQVHLAGNFMNSQSV